MVTMSPGMVADPVRAAQTALAAARLALRDADGRTLANAPDAQAARDDAIRRYARAMELVRRVRETGTVRRGDTQPR